MLYEWRDAKMLLILDALRIDHVKRFKSLQKIILKLLFI